MKNISFLSENFKFLEEKFSIYLNRRVLVMSLVHFLLMHEIRQECVLATTQPQTTFKMQLSVASFSVEKVHQLLV